ncbi:phosphotransferase family protein [Mangrovicoccus sp. HB161399]|uniref:phosphotransferase family protein n=1 Tax=Mangrovicoccus sp. HB161399 TaxID=2720392 RepID=UPI001557C896|nr:aminoglycoside phosphotransferase family protein [Mangrovicoccus sp. HB161399]
MRAAVDPFALDSRARHAAALEALGAAEAAAVPPLAMPSHCGLDGRVSFASLEGAAAAVKTFHRDALGPGGFAAAAEAHALASETGIGPRLLTADAATATLATERLGDGWRPAMVPDFVTGGKLPGLLAALKAWHGAGAVAAVSDPRADFSRLAEAAARPGMLALPATAGFGLAQLGDWVARICDALDAAPAEPVLLHGELMVSNAMLDGGGALKLLDFDRAAMGDPMRDLASLSLELCVDDDDRSALLAAWTGDAPARADLARMKLLALLEDAIWALWALAGEASEDRKGPELYKYACNRLVRFRFHLSLFDMAQLLREVRGA